MQGIILVTMSNVRGRGRACRSGHGQSRRGPGRPPTACCVMRCHHSPSTLEILNIDSCCISRPGSRHVSARSVTDATLRTPHTLHTARFISRHLLGSPIRYNPFAIPRLIRLSALCASKTATCNYECLVPSSRRSTFVYLRCVQVVEGSLSSYARRCSKTARALE